MRTKTRTLSSDHLNHGFHVSRSSTRCPPKVCSIIPTQLTLRERTIDYILERDPGEWQEGDSYHLREREPLLVLFQTGLFHKQEDLLTFRLSLLCYQVYPFLMLTSSSSENSHLSLRRAASGTGRWRGALSAARGFREWPRRGGSAGTATPGAS